MIEKVQKKFFEDSEFTRDYGEPNLTYSDSLLHSQRKWKLLGAYPEKPPIVTMRLTYFLTMISSLHEGQLQTVATIILLKVGHLNK